MRSSARIVAAVTVAAFVAATAGAQPSTAGPPPAAGAAPRAVPWQTSFKITDSFTAQRRPRVTVLTFEDTNRNAQRAKYGAAVEAMLVTFLKRKSQFVVVERQKINTILSEKQRLQTGMVQAETDDPAAQALLEKIDVFVLGSVTLLDVSGQDLPQDDEERSQKDFDAAAGEREYSDEEQENAEKKAARSGLLITSLGEFREPEEPAAPRQGAERWADIGGPRIEIDAKLISRFDGRIIAAAQRSGPVACLRSIIERLGVALEQEYLRPYYGTLTVTLNEPEHIRVFLTPIVPEDALDEDKPPVERSTTVLIGSERDIVEPWTTDPATYTISNLLSGWYSMRIERPGYSGIGLGNARWEVRKRQGKEVVYDRETNLPLDKVPLSIRRFVVRVTPLTTDVLDVKSLEFTFNKEGGSFTPLVKRQYLDTEFSQGPHRVILLGGPRIDLNRIDGPGEYADDPRCDLFVEETPELNNYGRTYVTAGQTFDLKQFTGGELIIEDYKGEVVPIGRYTMALWEPAYQVETTPVTVRNNDKSSIKVSLTRETAELHLGATGPRPANRGQLTGRDTRHRIQFPLDFSKVKQLPGVPVDVYTAGTDIADLKLWSHGFEIPATNLNPPFYDTSSERNEPRLLQALPPMAANTAPFVGIKTRFGLAGRIGALSRKPDPLAADLFIEPNVAKILNRLLYGVAARPEDEEDRPSLEEAAAQAGRDALAQTFTEVTLRKGKAGPEASVKGQPFSRRLRRASPQEEKAQGPDPAQETARDEREASGLEDGQPKKKEQREEAEPDPFPKDPEALRKLLAERLELVDLLVLDPVDMVQLRQSPEVAGIIARWVSAGGSLFAFVSSPGDYLDILGAPLTIEAMTKRTKRFDLAPGKMPGLVQISKKKIKSKGRRQLPEITDLDGAWRVLAYTREGKGPRIIDRGSRGPGGYVVLWFDDPATFRGRWGGTRPEVEQTRANVEGHVFRRARDLMRSRFAGTEPPSPTIPTGE